MATTLIRGGSVIDTPTPAEMRQIMAEQLADDRRQRAEADNVKRMELAVPIQPPAITFFASVTTLIGTPDEGYVWSLKLVAATLSAAATLVIYKASSSGQTTRPLASFQAQTANVPLIATWSSDQAELKHGEGLYLVAGSGTITGIYMTGEQVTAEKAAKIYD